MSEEWISVKDRLPEINTIIVVYKKSDVILHFYAVMDYKGILNPGLTHWMPLPEPPK